MALVECTGVYWDLTGVDRALLRFHWDILGPFWGRSGLSEVYRVLLGPYWGRSGLSGLDRALLRLYWGR